MINYYEIMKNLEKYSYTLKTTKELIEAGLNKYYIKKAVSEKKLKKVARGKYRITSEGIIYNNLKTHLYNKQFEEAYNDLQIILKTNNRIQYKYILILLNNILNKPNDPEDINLLNNHLVSEKNNTDNQDLYLTLAEAILTSNFEEADKIINSIIIKEKEKMGHTSYKTSYFYPLIKELNIRIKEKEKNTKFFQYYDASLKDIYNDNYESALVNLNNTLKYCDKKHIITNLIILTTAYIELKRTIKTLPEKNINYEFLNNPSKKLSTAFQLKDFKTAHKIINELLNNKNSKILNLYNTILNNILKQNEKNITYHQQRYSPSEINNIYSLITNKEYEKAKNILIDHSTNNQNTQENKQTTPNEDNPSEITLYKLLIENTLNSLEYNQDKENFNQEIYITISKLINTKTLQAIESLIEDKIKTCKEDEIIYNQYLLELIEVIRTTRKMELNETYFNTDDNNHNFFDAINNGNYPQALNIMSTENIFSDNNNNINWYLSLFKILLLKLSKELDNNNKMASIRNNTTNINLPELYKLKNLIEHNKYQQAYQLYKSNNFKNISENLDQDLQILLPLLVESSNYDQESILKLKYLKKGE